MSILTLPTAAGLLSLFLGDVMPWLLGLTGERVVIKARWSSQKAVDSESVRELLSRRWPDQFLLSPLEASATGRRGKCVTVTFSLSSDDVGEQMYGEKYEWMVCGGKVHPLSKS